MSTSTMRQRLVVDQIARALASWPSEQARDRIAGDLAKIAAAVTTAGRDVETTATAAHLSPAGRLMEAKRALGVALKAVAAYDRHIEQLRQSVESYTARALGALTVINPTDIEHRDAEWVRSKLESMSPAQRGARYREAAESGNRIVMLAVARAKAAGFPLVGPEDERAAQTLAIERSPLRDALDVEQRELVLYTRAVEAARLDLSDLARRATLNLAAIERALADAVA